MCGSPMGKAIDHAIHKGLLKRVAPPVVQKRLRASATPVQGGAASKQVMGVPTKQRSPYIKGRGLLTEANLSQPTLLG